MRFINPTNILTLVSPLLDGGAVEQEVPALPPCHQEEDRGVDREGIHEAIGSRPETLHLPGLSKGR